jgi:hypothetical protein
MVSTTLSVAVFLKNNLCLLCFFSLLIYGATRLSKIIINWFLIGNSTVVALFIRFPVLYGKEGSDLSLAIAV